MPCYRPWDQEYPKASGLYRKLPCGRCIGCRIAHRQMWSLRMYHESLFHDELCFVTLTYRDQDLPPHQGLVKSHAQNFLKRLRRFLAPRKIRYYLCGEYGGASLRPHYHAILYGWRPNDLKVHSPGDTHDTYTSARLEAIWGLGFCTVGDVTRQTCAYTAGYVTKKITGPQAETHYERLHLHTGEVASVLPEFALMSRGRKRGEGLGGRYYATYGAQLANWDFIVQDGTKRAVPRYYDKLRELDDLTGLERTKYDRLQRARQNKSNNTPERLASREEFQLKRPQPQRGN